MQSAQEGEEPMPSAQRHAVTQPRFALCSPVAATGYNPRAGTFTMSAQQNVRTRAVGTPPFFPARHMRSTGDAP
jgi:hypothetical protein